MKYTTCQYAQVLHKGNAIIAIMFAEASDPISGCCLVLLITLIKSYLMHLKLLLASL